ncbi:calcium/sodium antiporter [uncultured Umboniibacter sp.]|uniref:calcium/sodium antiporter n=1 Tax=uncultured Umboniibacter sp. TaxID=1798917 RepID=UPI002604696C|nr:calcium/sodium antiporter [uncultured Umboniibacter sp.]
MPTEIVYQTLAILLGFSGLIWSADRFVASSASIAKNLGMSTMTIGLTIVSLGTSAPEVLVALSASLDNSGSLAMGNALGSNVANIALVLAITAIVAPIPIAKQLFKMEAPFLVGVTALLGLFIFNGELSPLEGLILLLLIPVFLWLVSRTQADLEQEEIEGSEGLKTFLWFVVSLAILIGSANTLVWGAKGVALTLGVSELVIGLTIVAIGTSLPELAASVASALKGHHDIALGNIIGSNIFNIIAVASIPGVVGPLVIEADILSRDYYVMAGLTALLVIACALTLKRTHSKLGRSFGVVMLSCFCAYYYFLV